MEETPTIAQPIEQQNITLATPKTSTQEPQVLRPERHQMPSKPSGNAETSNPIGQDNDILKMTVGALQASLDLLKQNRGLSALGNNEQTEPDPADDPRLRKGSPVKGEFSWTQEGVSIDQHPLFRLTARALNYNPDQIAGSFHEIADMAKMTAEYLGTSDPNAAYDFLSDFFLHTHARSSWALKRELTRHIQEAGETYGK